MHELRNGQNLLHELSFHTRDVYLVCESVCQRRDSAIVDHQENGLREIGVDFVGDSIRDVVRRHAVKTQEQVE